MIKASVPLASKVMLLLMGFARLSLMLIPNAERETISGSVLNVMMDTS